MRSIVLPWYPGGHVLSNMQGRYLYLQDRHGEGSQKKKQSKKSWRLQPYHRVRQESRRSSGELQELKKNQAQPARATAPPPTQRPKSHSPQFKIIW